MEQLRNGMEHRWGERVAVNIPVYVSAGSFAGFDGCMKNLSLSGALLKSDCQLRLHGLIDVHIKLPAPSPRVDIVKAHVSRKLTECVGIEWCEFAPTIVKDLLRSRSVRFSG
jgi:PilZ domain